MYLRELVSMGHLKVEQIAIRALAICKRHCLTSTPNPRVDWSKPLGRMPLLHSSFGKVGGWIAGTYMNIYRFIDGIIVWLSTSSRQRITLELQ